MKTSGQVLPGGIGLWGGFLDRLSAADAVSAVGEIERFGADAVWLQEYSGVDPFIRAALYLHSTEHLTVALGVANIHARDPEAMVAAASTLHEAFPGRFVLGLGTSHRHLVETRGHSYARPLGAMRTYLAEVEAAVGDRTLPPWFLGALGPRMVELAGAATGGVHTYFAPVTHTAALRAALGKESWIAPSQMVAADAGPRWRDTVRPYLRLCAQMPNYRSHLGRLGFGVDQLDEISDGLIDALVVPAEPTAINERLIAHRRAGADHVAIQFVPPPSATNVMDLAESTFRDRNIER